MEKINETKLIIEGKEFELIKYSCDLDDKWYCGELGLMIEKRVWTGTNPEIPKGKIKWVGYSIGKEENQLQYLIHCGEDEVEYWEKKIKMLDPVLESEKLKSFKARLERAENGLKELLQLKAKKGHLD